MALRDFEFEPETLYAGLDATTSLTFTFGSGAASKDARVLACPSGRSTVHVDLLVPVDRGHLWEAFKGVLYIPHLPVNGNLRNPLGPIAHSRDADGKRSSVSDRPGDAVSPSGKRTRECESGRPSNDTALAPGGKLETKDGVTDDGAMSCAKLHHPASLDSFLSAPRKARSSLGRVSFSNGTDAPSRSITLVGTRYDTSGSKSTIALPAPPGSSFEASLDVGAAGARKRLSSSLTQNSTTSSDSRTLVGSFDWISSKQAEALSPPPPAATRTPPSSTPPTVALPVVVKFAVVSPSQKPVHVHPSETELEQTLSAAEAVQAIRREVDLYMGALRDAGLVGHTTCGFHGVWRAETERGEEVWAMLLDELGPAVAAAWSELDPRWRSVPSLLFVFVTFPHFNSP